MASDIFVDYVEQFHRKYDHPIADVNSLDINRNRQLRIALISEEFDELLEALKNDDAVEAADALGDMLVVIIGACLTWGIPIEKVMAEIHRSNMSKLGEDGLPIYREDGNYLRVPTTLRLTCILFCFLNALTWSSHEGRDNNC